MGSVPRINRLLSIVPRTILPYDFFKIGLVIKLAPKCVSFKNLFYSYDKLGKGVSIESHRLPYSLKLVTSYPISSNSKAA